MACPSPVQVESAGKKSAVKKTQPATVHPARGGPARRAAKADATHGGHGASESRQRRARGTAGPRRTAASQRPAFGDLLSFDPGFDPGTAARLERGRRYWRPRGRTPPPRGRFPREAQRPPPPPARQRARLASGPGTSGGIAMPASYTRESLTFDTVLWSAEPEPICACRRIFAGIEPPRLCWARSRIRGRRRRPDPGPRPAAARAAALDGGGESGVVGV